MKLFVVVFALCLIATVFGALTDEQKAKLREDRAGCVTETGVSDDVITKLKKGEDVVFDEKLNCFSACMLKKIGVMRADGTIDEQAVRAKVPKDVPQDKVDLVINMCKGLGGKNVCEAGGRVVGCLAKTKAVHFLN